MVGKRTAQAKEDPHTTVIGGIIEGCHIQIHPSVNKETISAATILAEAAKENAAAIKAVADMLSNNKPDNVCGIRIESPPQEK